VIKLHASFQSSPKINRMLIQRLICTQQKSSRFFSPVSTVSGTPGAMANQFRYVILYWEVQTSRSYFEVKILLLIGNTLSNFSDPNCGMLVLNEDLKKLCHKIHDNSNSETDYHRIYTEWNIKIAAQNNGWEQNRRYNTANTKGQAWMDKLSLRLFNNSLA